MSQAEIIAEAAVHAKGGRLARSLASLSACLAQSPDSAELLYARGLTLLDWGRFREALEDLRAAEASGMSTLKLHLNLAQACHALGFTDEGERHVRRALVFDDSVPAAHFELGSLLQSTRQYEEAIRSYEHAYALAPDRADCAMHIVACMLELQDEVAAEAAAREAITRHGDEAKLWGLLGIALTSQDRFDEAAKAFERAEELEALTGSNAETFVMHGFQLLWAGRVKEALDLYARYLPGSPDPGALANYGLMLLTAGRLREGWPLYEFRWCYDPMNRKPRFVCPEWRGQDLQGKAVLLWAEQGAGDVVQFVRFAHLLKAKGASVALRVSEGLKEFARGFPGTDRVIVDPPGLARGFDYHISIMSVAGALGLDIASIQADVPYLTIENERRRRWHERLVASTTLNVGIVWAGNPKHKRDRFRSMPLSRLKQVLLTAGVQFYSLQKERRPEDVIEGTGMIDLAPDLEDFRDTAAAIDTLDLVICVDTAVAHIAGALAKPVWVMLAAASDFRWLTEREDTPWYPTMRLFRQQRLGDWDDVVGNIEVALREAVQARKEGRTAFSPVGSGALHRAKTVRPDALTHTASTSDLCRVAETRYGMIQHLARGRLAESLDYYGEWLQPQLEVVAKLMRPGATVLEAGSGIGAHAVAIAQMIGPSGHLFIYEDDAMAKRILEQNLHTSDLRNRVTVMRYRLGASSVSERQEVLAAAACVANQTSAGFETVDELILSRLELLKVNGDADALTILDGAGDTLWRLRPRLFLAVPGETALRAIASRARDFGYRCWRLETALFNKENFNRREDEIFAGMTAMAMIGIPEEIELDLARDGCLEV